MELNSFFITWVYYALSPDVHLLEFCLFSCVHRPCWTWWWMETKSNEIEKTWHKIKNPSKDDENQTRTTKRSGHSFFDCLVGTWGPSLTKVISLCFPKGFPSNCRNPEKHQETEDSFSVEYGLRAQAQNLLQAACFIDRPMEVSIHKSQNSSQGVIRCWDLADILEVEIQDEWKDQGVVGVSWVMAKEVKLIPTNTLFLMFSSPELTKEIMVRHLKMKVALFVPNLMCCFNCNKSGHMSQCCKVAAKCQWCGKYKYEDWCEGPKLCSNCNDPPASVAQDRLVWKKEKEIQCIWVEKYISFLEARHLVEARMLTVISSSKSYSAVGATKKDIKSMECQDCAVWFACFWWTQISTGWQPGILWEDGAGIGWDPRTVWIRKNFRRFVIMVQLIPPKWHLMVQPIPPKLPLRVQLVPPKLCPQWMMHHHWGSCHLR